MADTTLDSELYSSIAAELDLVTEESTNKAFELFKKRCVPNTRDTSEQTDKLIDSISGCTN